MYINIHTHKVSSKTKEIQLFNLTKQNDAKETYFSSGIHPWYILDFEISEMLKKVEENLKNKYCLALGEVGLDKAISIPIEIQKDVLIQQLNLNLENKKPVILHIVKAAQEVLEIIKPYSFSFIYHGFTKNEILAKQFVNNGVFLSFGKALLTNEKLQEVFKTIPLENIFLETDNDDISIEEIYQKAAEILNISVAKLEQNIEHNYNSIFTWKHQNG